MSEQSVPHVYVAMHEVQAYMAEEGIKKGRRGQDGMYRGIDDVYNVLSDALRKAALIITPTSVTRHRDERARDGKAPAIITVLEVEYTFISAKDGTKHVSVMHAEGTDFSDKSTGKAFSYAYKQLAFQTFCIPIEGHSPDSDDEKPELPQKPANRAAAAVGNAQRPSHATPPPASKPAPAASKPAEPKPQARHELYWALFKNSSHKGQLVSGLQDADLVNYIERLEKAVKSEKIVEGVTTYPYRADALLYLAVATKVMAARMPPEDTNPEWGIGAQT